MGNFDWSAIEPNGKPWRFNPINSTPHPPPKPPSKPTGDPRPTGRDVSSFWRYLWWRLKNGGLKSHALAFWVGANVYSGLFGEAHRYVRLGNLLVALFIAALIRDPKLFTNVKRRFRRDKKN